MERKAMWLLNQKVNKVNEKKYEVGGMEKTKGKRKKTKWDKYPSSCREAFIYLHSRAQTET